MLNKLKKSKKEIRKKRKKDREKKRENGKWEIKEVIGNKERETKEEYDVNQQNEMKNKKSLLSKTFST